MRTTETQRKYRGGRDERAVSPVVGFVLVIAISTIALTLLQFSAVPIWNEGVEFDHSQSVQDDMQNLRAESIQTSATGRASAANIELGTEYPRRFLLLNPPSPSGTVSTGEESAFVLENVVATDNETADYWNGNPVEFPTKSLVYEPRYNVLSDDRTVVYEGTGAVVYVEERDGQATVSDTVLVSGRRITLVSVDGSLSKSGSGTEPLDLVPLSAPGTSVSVTNVTGNDGITISVPTALSQERWEDLLTDQTVGNGGYVSDISVDEGEDVLTVKLVSKNDGEDVEYDLRMTKVGVGSRLTEEGGHYLTTEGSTQMSVAEGSTLPVVVQVRDRYNNPVSGVTVGFDSDGDLSADEVRTDERGEARVTYEPPQGISKVRASMAGRAADPAFDASTKEDIEFTVTAVSSGGSGSGGDGSDINPNPSGLVLEGATIEQCGGTGPGQGGGQTVVCASTMEFRNTESAPLTVAQARLNFYSPDQGQGQGTFRQPPSRGVLEGTSLDIGGLFEPVNLVFGPGVSQNTVEFYRGGNEFEIEDGDFYVVTFLFEDGDRSTYFVLPQP
ncbi:MAG: Ig-like domain-containing protein [Halobacteriales archaeon]|nr:Ig-like domain-containing protein [Halobacteriales archaeon]